MASTATIMMCVLIASAAAVASAYPRLESCGIAELQTGRDDISWTERIDPSDKVQTHFELKADEFVLFRIRTGLDDVYDTPEEEDTTKCENFDDDLGDDLFAFQPFDDDVLPCGFGFQDDDAVPTVPNNLGSYRQLLIIEVKESASNGIIGRKFSVVDYIDFGGDLFLTARGQKHQCGRPYVLEIEGIEGSGGVEVKAEFYRRENWNLASVDFEMANDALSQPTWCGNINWIRDVDEDLCSSGANNPKWTVSLDKNETLLVTALLEGRQLSESKRPLRVMLHIYKEMGGEKIAEILDESVFGKETFQRSFVNTGAPSLFYLELDHDVRHLYRYQIAFQVQNSCTDNPSAKIQVPQFMKTCAWLQSKTKKTRDKSCQSFKSNADVVCPTSCGTCDSLSAGCSERSNDEFHKKLANCAYIRKKKVKLERKGQLDEICERFGSDCPVACDKCL